ncbi:YadA family autotransporter adhesin [Moraxella lacunata]|uniref:YadA family autotransporter adhesin n=1 Tax=Moraxella lacunata TaxID=477 RepID=UPI003EE2743A
MAAGEISDKSTDAINGSQLYMVAKGTLEQMPVVYTNKNGDKVFKKSDGSFADGTGDTVNNSDVIASMQNADGTTNNPTALANVAGNLEPTYNVGDNVVGIDGVLKPNVTRLTATTEQAAPTNVAGIYNNAATVGDVLNVGWNLQGNGTAKDFVKAYDTVNFVNGTGTTAKVTTNKEGTSSNVTFDVNTDGTTITTKEVADPNNPGKTITQVTANTTKLGDANKDGKVDTPSDANKGKLVTAGDIANAINNAGFNVQTNGGNKELVKTGETVNFVNGDNIQITNDGKKITVATAKDVTFNSVTTGNTTLKNNGLTIAGGPSVTNTGINAGNKRITNVTAGTKDTDAVNLKQLKDSRTTVQSSDNSISVTKTEKDDRFDYDIKVNNQVIVENAQLPVVYTNQDGDKLTKAPNGKFYKPEEIAKATLVGDKYYAPDQLEGGKPKPGATAINPTANNNVIASMQNADGSTTAPTTLTNVKSNLPSTYNNDVYNTGNKPVTTGQTLPEKINTSNAATAGDVLNSGWNLQGNGVAKDFVKAYDTVNFVNGTGTTAKVTTNKEGTSSDVTFDVNTDGTTITTKKVADPNNPGKTITQVTANTTKLGDANKDGKVDTPSDDNKGKLVTAGDIANAINNAGFTLTVQGEKGSLVKPGATVNMKNTDNNIVIDKSANSNDVVYNLAKDITVDSVKAGDTTLNNNGVTINNGPSFTKDKVDVAGNKITGVADGDISATSKDAINGSQLHAVARKVDNLNARIDGVADDANAGVSSAMAMAALPQAYLPGKSMLTGGMASYNGEGAVAVGFSKLSDNGRWVLKMSGSADTQGNAGVAVGAGFHF